MCVVGSSSSFGLASRLSEKLDDVGGMFIFFVIFVVLREKVCHQSIHSSWRLRRVRSRMDARIEIC